MSKPKTNNKEREKLGKRAQMRAMRDGSIYGYAFPSRAEREWAKAYIKG